jgi:hypothetical protein
MGFDHVAFFSVHFLCPGYQLVDFFLNMLKEKKIEMPAKSANNLMRNKSK